MKFSTAPLQEIIEKPWGREVLYTARGSPHVGKLIFVMAGKRLSLQYHDAKRETLCLVLGRAVLWLENDAGAIEKLAMEPLKGYDIALGQKHRLEALEDCLVAEVSDPEQGNTYRLDDDYRRGTETETLRAEKNRGWDSDEGGGDGA